MKQSFHLSPLFTQLVKLSLLAGLEVFARYIGLGLGYMTPQTFTHLVTSLPNPNPSALRGPTVSGNTACPSHVPQAHNIFFQDGARLNRINWGAYLQLCVTSHSARSALEPISGTCQYRGRTVRAVHGVFLWMRLTLTFARGCQLERPEEEYLNQPAGHRKLLVTQDRGSGFCTRRLFGVHAGASVCLN